MGIYFQLKGKWIRLPCVYETTKQHAIDEINHLYSLLLLLIVPSQVYMGMSRNRGIRNVLIQAVLFFDNAPFQKHHQSRPGCHMLFCHPFCKFAWVCSWLGKLWAAWPAKPDGGLSIVIRFLQSFNIQHNNFTCVLLNTEQWAQLSDQILKLSFWPCQHRCPSPWWPTSSGGRV